MKINLATLLVALLGCGAANAAKRKPKSMMKSKKKNKKSNFVTLTVQDTITFVDDGGDVEAVLGDDDIPGFTIVAADGLRIREGQDDSTPMVRRRRLEDCLEGGILRFGTTDDSSIGKATGCTNIPGLLLQDPDAIRFMGPQGEPTGLEFGETGECRITPFPGSGLEIRDPDGVRILTPLEQGVGPDAGPAGRRRRLEDGAPRLGGKLLFGPTDDCRIMVNPLGPAGIIISDPMGLRLLNPDGKSPSSILFGPTDECRIRVGPNRFTQQNSMILEDPGGFLFDSPVADATTTVNVNGDIFANNLMQTSSRRFKTNIRTISDAVDKLLELRGVYFDWKRDGTADLGFIAEEVAQVFPQAVSYEPDGQTVKGVKYSNLVAVSVEAIKAHHETILELQDKVDKFQEQFTTQEKRLEELEAQIKILTLPSESVA